MLARGQGMSWKWERVVSAREWDLKKTKQNKTKQNKKNKEKRMGEGMIVIPKVVSVFSVAILGAGQRGREMSFPSAPWKSSCRGRVVQGAVWARGQRLSLPWKCWLSMKDSALEMASWGPLLLLCLKVLPNPHAGDGVNHGGERMSVPAGSLKRSPVGQPPMERDSCSPWKQPPIAPIAVQTALILPPQSPW